MNYRLFILFPYIHEKIFLQLISVNHHCLFALKALHGLNPSSQVHVLNSALKALQKLFFED